MLYDPLTYDNLMMGLVVHFQKQPQRSLGEAASVEGPGVYALYYAGALPAYAPIASGEAPIYVGKAIPPGSRKGDAVDAAVPALRRRINAARQVDWASRQPRRRRLPLQGSGGSARMDNACGAVSH